MNPLLSTAIPCPCGASKEPITLPALSIWIIAGGRTQQSASGGFNSASSSISVRSFGRFRTQTLSSLSTARPVTPPIFHLFGRGLGQSGSNLNRGAVCACAHTVSRQTATHAATRRQFMNPPEVPRHGHPPTNLRNNHRKGLVIGRGVDTSRMTEPTLADPGAAVGVRSDVENDVVRARGVTGNAVCIRQ